MHLLVKLYIVEMHSTAVKMGLHMFPFCVEHRFCKERQCVEAYAVTKGVGSCFVLPSLIFTYKRSQNKAEEGLVTY